MKVISNSRYERMINLEFMYNQEHKSFFNILKHKIVPEKLDYQKLVLHHSNDGYYVVSVGDSIHKSNTNIVIDHFCKKNGVIYAVDCHRSKIKVLDIPLNCLTFVPKK